jgi:hypothetical protein
MPTPSWGKEVEMSRVRGELFLPAVLLAFLLGPPAAKADTFVFNDLSETITVSGPSPVTCTTPPDIVPGEVCAITISPPDGAASVEGLGTLHPLIAEPDGVTISDVLFASGPFPGGLSFQEVFISDHSESTPDLCAVSPDGCRLTENGQIQTVGTVTWLDVGGATLRTDTIEFASDISDVPEPASWLLVLSGLPLVGLRRLRRPLRAS